MLTCTLVVFDGMDLLDAGGPYEVLMTASRLLERDGHAHALRVQAAGLDSGVVHAYGGLGVEASVALAEVTETNVLVVPGAIDISLLTDYHELLAQVARLAGTATLTLSVCTGSFLLGAAGLLADRPWTTHHEDIDALAPFIGSDRAERGPRWVDSGDIVTAAGLSSGIAGALHVVERLFGRELAQRTAKQIEYDWSPATAQRTLTI